MFSIPNILDKEHNVLGEKNIGVPIGKDENDNIEIISGGTKQNFSFKPLSHYELGIKNN
jgi:seryl-tRNA synthetase